MIPLKVIEKATSGRFWLTIISGFVFAYAVWKRILPAEATATIITMVFINYFQRDKKQNNEGGQR